MKIRFKKEEGLTQAGREKFSFSCSECKTAFWLNFPWFYDPRLFLKEKNEENAQLFADAISNNKYEEITDSEKLIKLMRRDVCNCTEDRRKIIDLEYELRVLRAKKLVDPSIEIPESLIRTVKNIQPDNVKKFWTKLETLGVEVRELVYEGEGMWGFKICVHSNCYLDYAYEKDIIDFVKEEIKKYNN